MKRRWFAVAAACAILAAVLHLTLIDGLHGEVFARVLGDDTRYADGYTTRGFRSIQPGMSESDVKEILGSPLGEMWDFGEGAPERLVYMRNGVTHPVVREMYSGKIRPDMSAAEVIAVLGEPRRIAWRYSESPRSSHYRERDVIFEKGRVIEVVARVYLD